MHFVLVFAVFLNMWSYSLYSYLIWWPRPQELESPLGGGWPGIYIYIYVYVCNSDKDIILYTYVYHLKQAMPYLNQGICWSLHAQRSEANFASVKLWKPHAIVLVGQQGYSNHSWNLLNCIVLCRIYVNKNSFLFVSSLLSFLHTTLTNCRLDGILWPFLARALLALDDRSIALEREECVGGTST